MGEFIQDIINAVAFGFSWLQDSKMWKYYAAFVVLQFLLVGLVVGFLVTLFLGTGALSDVYSDSGSAPAWGQSLLAFGAAAFLIFLALLALFVVGYVYVSLLVMVRAMKQKGIPAVPITLRKTLAYLWLNLIVFLYVLFSWKDKRFLAIAGGAFVLLLGFAATQIWFLLFLSFLFGVTYLFVMAYMGVRLNFSSFAFIQEEISVSESIAVSWKMTENRALGAFARIFGSMMVVSVLISLVLLIPNVFFFFLRLFVPVFGLVLEQGFKILTAPLSTIATLFAYTSIYFVYLQLHGLVEMTPDAPAFSPEPVEPPVRSRRPVRRKKA